MYRLSTGGLRSDCGLPHPDHHLLEPRHISSVPGQPLNKTKGEGRQGTQVEPKKLK
jgi:hypothetical protein